MTLAVSIAQGGSNNVTMRNRIINGAMMIDQRNGGASVSTPVGGGGAATFGVDRFPLYNQIDGGFSIQQVSDAPAGLKYSLKITTTSAASGSPASNALAMLNQVVEAYNISDINEGSANAQSLTLSFWVKSSLTGSFTVTAENNNDRTFLTTYTINSANTWEKKTVVIPPCIDGTWNVTNGRGIYVRWGLLGGSSYQQAANAAWQAIDGKFFVPGTVALAQTLNATLQITGVQLEAGTTATPFEQRLYGTELALCQRYFYSMDRSPGNTTSYAVATCYGNDWAYISSGGRHPVEMRAIPTLSTVSTFRVEDAYSTAYTVSTITLGSTSRLVFSPSIQFSTTATAGRVVYLQATSDSSRINLSAEL